MIKSSVNRYGFRYTHSTPDAYKPFVRRERRRVGLMFCSDLLVRLMARANLFEPIQHGKKQPKSIQGK